MENKTADDGHAPFSDPASASWQRPTKALKRRIVRSLVGQLMQPHGVGGHVSGWVMAHRSSNVRRNRWVVALLHVEPTDRVLEIGFGPGVAVRELNQLASKGPVFGVDHSDVMIKLATRRVASGIRDGRVDLRLGSVEALPDLGGPLDKIVAINNIGFWPDPIDRLRELRGRLRPGGKIAIASQPRCPRATSQTSDRASREIEAKLRQAGFVRSHVETLDLDPPVVCVIAEVCDD